MNLECEMCGTDTDIEAKYCCNSRDCDCNGNYINEELIVCPDCQNVLEYIENLKDKHDFDYSILKRDKKGAKQDVTFDMSMVEI